MIFQIIYSLVSYLMIGVLVTMSFEWVLSKINSEGFTSGERLAVIVFWPIGILSFVWGWFRGK